MSVFSGMATAFSGTIMSADYYRVAKGAAASTASPVNAHLQTRGEVSDIDDTGLVGIRPLAIVRRADGWQMGDWLKDPEGRWWLVKEPPQDRADPTLLEILLEEKADGPPSG